MSAVRLLTAAEARAGPGPEQVRGRRTAARRVEQVKPAGRAVVSALERESHDRTERTVRALLGDAEFTARRAEGGVLTREEAAAP
ncbi:hypothetical protein QMZ92_27500 [Streptomyces sp. HNM0645]|uniref:hypothetical protein n=1 Tax=Streptomyces sp. HNM0645 TaxID=2782343 RepID=UPI0024B68DD1|nr:hypothetical protein [Streptomyces sp. HNM0645]MDI9888012.1 hypothetical protein [Streptomyces sp. HNM0645]